MQVLVGIGLFSGENGTERIEMRAIRCRLASVNTHLKEGFIDLIEKKPTNNLKRSYLDYNKQPKSNRLTIVRSDSVAQ